MPPGSSRGRKRFLQDGARRNTLSSPCAGTQQRCHQPPPLPFWKEGGKSLALSFSACEMNLLRWVTTL